MSNRQRVGSAASSRAPIASTENQVLRTTVSRLQQQLLLSNAESQRVSEQLSCMMLLVKRAWQGDKKAAVNVANIVGVAPPDFEEDSSGFGIVTTPKSRALNNWAVLTIGILNRAYKAAEEQLEARQQYYLHNRQAYLDEQMLYHRHLQMKVQAEMSQESQLKKIDKARQIKQSLATNYQNVYNMFERNKPSQVQIQPQQSEQSLLKKSNSYTEGSRRRIKSASHVERGGHRGSFITQPVATQSGLEIRPQSAKPKASANRHVRRSASQAGAATDLAWGDLVIDPTRNKVQQQNAKENSENCAYKMDDTQRDSSQARYGRQWQVSYDDPARYNMDNLYNLENVLGPGSRQRPMSGKDQRDSDSLRSRPKSAAYIQGERQMKYEVVRPSSAAKSRSTTSNRRPPSGKKSQHVGRGNNTQLNNKYAPINGQNEPKHNENGNTDIQMEPSVYSDSEDEFATDEVVYDEKTFQKLGIDLNELERAERIPVMKINIKKPQSVIDFERDMTDMHCMEKEIKKAALALQKKLGITQNGMI